MFEFLTNEIAKIKTRKFHLVDGPAAPEFQMAAESSALPLPPSYKVFVSLFGNAKLYRRITDYNSNYLIEIYAGHREAVSEDGESLFQIGRTESSLAYFKEALLVEDSESPVFEWRYGRGTKQIADGFLNWLKEKCKSARKQYKRKEWAAIEDGPLPFTEQEVAVVEARKRFRWRVIGIAANGDLRFEIYNGSDLILPYLFVGIHGKLRPPKSGSLEGAARLPVSSIRPGETKIVDYDCYKGFATPEDIEAFEMPDPGPEDRKWYWEFKAIP